MGLETTSELHIDGQVFQVKALLESRELILRGAVKKTLPISDICDPQVIADQLVFEYSGQPYVLVLPTGQAPKWLKKLTTAPPSLASKLGIEVLHKAYVVGAATDAALAEALTDAVTQEPKEAAVGIAIASAPDDLSRAIARLLDVLPLAPVWVIFPKGTKSTLPESAVRCHVHALGFVDTKACAVSDVFTAARFHRRK